LIKSEGTDRGRLTIIAKAAVYAWTKRYIKTKSIWW
jgi:hypothetical protein